MGRFAFLLAQKLLEVVGELSNFTRTSSQTMSSWLLPD